MPDKDMGAGLLTCPLCNEALTQDSKQLRCPNNHCFDMAKQGYTNLLPVQHKRSKTPGDDKAMVLARQSFLSAGFYEPLANRLATIINQNKFDSIKLLDAGSGEGYYSNHIYRALLEPSPNKPLDFYGIDISKPAIIEACKRNKDITWLVASLRNIPLANNQFDWIVSVFSPLMLNEFAAKLKAEGSLLVVTPGNQHLASLKEKLYDDVTPFDENKTFNVLEKDWRLVQQDKLQYEFHLTSQAMIQALLTMTPHTWRISPDNKARVEHLNDLSCEADFLITHWQKSTE